MTTQELKTLEDLNEAIDQLSADAGEVSTEAKVLLDLAWWFTEDAIRTETGKCSSWCKPADSWCPCCTHYNELRSQAQAIRSRL